MFDEKISNQNFTETQKPYTFATALKKATKTGP
jgi:hypothetical protein